MFTDATGTYAVAGQAVTLTLTVNATGVTAANVKLQAKDGANTAVAPVTATGFTSSMGPATAPSVSGDDLACTNGAVYTTGTVTYTYTVSATASHNTITFSWAA